MCGIVGYIGPRQAGPILINGLRRLEYRGYDSAGVAIINDGRITLRKTVGKLNVMAKSLEDDPIPGSLGIGHTRWATHGKPSVPNAHPHPDCTGDIMVVHNGIIENFLALREQLQKEGHVFKSETDTEVIAHLIEKYYQGDLKTAVQKAVADLEGAYAICVLCRHEPDRLVAARYFSPLIFGLGEGENFVASDIPAILDQTKKVYILDDGDMGVITREGIQLFRVTGEPVTKDVYEVQWDSAAAEKGGYKHFMLKEIHEQPRAVRDTMRGRVGEGATEVNLTDMNLSDETVRKMERIIISACGTAYYAGLVGKFVLENWARIPVDSDIASEYRYRNPIIPKNSIGIIISQSGETADTLAAQRMIRAAGAPIVSIVNAVGSSVSRESDGVLYTYAGPEIGVASTKAYTTQVTTFYLIALHLARVRGTLTPAQQQELIKGLWELPDKAQWILENKQEIMDCCDRYWKDENFLYLGRGVNLASAYEGALKLKEISYIHAEGYAAGEMKHGPIALISPQCPTVAVAIEGEVYDKVLSNMQEVRARDGQVIAVAFEGDKEIEKYADFVLHVPRCHEHLSPVLVALPLQLLAYYIADKRGCDVDQPRNLAKSVTVE
jgi:glucosamine--fructose-6-phosphate aminotransferase (isomerizing)